MARSDEAKALGVKMAQPAFRAKDLIERHGIAVISGNLQFYTDMSNRVMQAFGELVPAVEKYSIDECFLDLTGIPEELTAFCQRLKCIVRQWTGLPISIGIAETKTLAKVANRLAKTSAKTDGVLDLTGERWRDRALASTEVGDIWGIGRQYAQKLCYSARWFDADRRASPSKSLDSGGQISAPNNIRTENAPVDPPAVRDNRG